jgi:transcriptional regulator with XRE-family HTH domain
MENLKVVLAKRIKHLRTQMGWNQPDMAAKAGLSVRTISIAESGEHSLNLETVEAVAKTFGITVSELLAPEKNAISVKFDRLKLLQDLLPRLMFMDEKQLLAFVLLANPDFERGHSGEGSDKVRNDGNKTG